MKELVLPIAFSILLIFLCVVGVVYFARPRAPRPSIKKSTVRRVIKPVYGVNTSTKYIREVDTLYSVGDTIPLDLAGISYDNECIIVK